MFKQFSSTYVLVTFVSVTKTGMGGGEGGFKEIPLKTKFPLIFTFQTDCALYFPRKYVNSRPTSGYAQFDEVYHMLLDGIKSFK